MEWIDQGDDTAPNGKVENVNKQIEKKYWMSMICESRRSAEAIRDWIRFYNLREAHGLLRDGAADRFLFGWNEE